MAKPFFGLSLKLKGALAALLAVSVLMTGCNTDKKNTDGPHGDTIPVNNGPVIDTNVLPPVATGWDLLNLMVRTDPFDPQNEVFLDDWRFQIYNIDDDGRLINQLYWGSPDATGIGAIGLPAYMFELPIVVQAYNEAYPLSDEIRNESFTDECRVYEIFIPPNCYNKAVWFVGPVETALWDFYRQAAERKAEAWNPSQVDCGTWINNLALLISTDVIEEALENIDEDDFFLPEGALIEAFQEFQQVLVPTRPPICMAEYRHNGGGMERADQLTLGSPNPDIGGDFPYTLDDFDSSNDETDSDPVVIGGNGIVDQICDQNFDGVLVVNGGTFAPTKAFTLDDPDFLGTIHDQDGPPVDMEVSAYNVRQTNGREGDSEIYDDVCSVTELFQFTNTDDDEQDVLSGTGVTFTDLFDTGVDDVAVYLTSDGDAVVDDNDYWVILYDANDGNVNPRVIAITLLGHRQEDFRDVLHFNLEVDDLFIGLRADYELNEEEVDGEQAFFGYTITTWNGTSDSGRHAVRKQIADCYLASDPPMRQYFDVQDFQDREDDCCINEDCFIDDLITSLRAAEFAERSECFSNSRANQRWQNNEAGLWAMNTTHGVAANVIVNPGWLAPNLDFAIYINRIGEAAFHGPRTIRTSDELGQLTVEIPTLVEGDRILIKAEDSRSSDYDLVIPCVPEFTGFIGLPGKPFLPPTLGPIGPVAAGPLPLLPNGVPVGIADAPTPVKN